jgi:photosystem II stability/assembly factor-like uncharacterized protein
MKRGWSTVIEILFSLAFVGLLLWVGMNVKPKAAKVSIQMPTIEKRDRFYGAAHAPDQPKIIWAIGKEGKILKSENGAQSWQKQSIDSRINLQDVAAWDSQKAVIVGNDGAVFYTEDGGKNWHKTETPRSEVDNKLFRVKISPSGQAIAVGVMGAVFASGDFGKSWHRIAPEEDVAWNDVTFKGNAIWVVGEFGQIKYTDDGGQAWKTIASSTDRSLMSIAFRDELNGLAVGLEGTMIETKDGGLTWTALPKVTAEHLFDAKWQNDHWFIVGDRGVMITGRQNDFKAAQLSDREYGWHTKIESIQDMLIIAGSSLGIYKDHQWHSFEAGETK